MALGVQISSFFIANVPGLGSTYGFYKTPSSVQIQRIQVSANSGQVVGNMTFELVNELGTALGGTAVLVAGTSYVDSPLAAPITLAPDAIVRVMIAGTGLNNAQNVTISLIGATSQGSNAPAGCAPRGGCGSPQDVCLPPQASLMFFPGTQGPAGPTGPTGSASTAPGPAGPAGPVLALVGNYSPTGRYYDNANRRDVVAYAGSYWIANNPALDGLNTWSPPNVADWAFFGASIANISTGWVLSGPQQIPVEVTVVSPGSLHSNNYVPGTAGWTALANGSLQAFDAQINGIVSTGTPKFNLASLTRTMPTIGNALYQIMPIADGAIPVNPLVNLVTDASLIFYGWQVGTNGYIANRFGNTTQSFQINLQGVGNNNSAGLDLFYIQTYYEISNDGGITWSAPTVIGQDTYMLPNTSLGQSFQNTQDLVLGLTGTQCVRFSAGFSKGASGIADVQGAQISVKAYN